VTDRSNTHRVIIAGSALAAAGQAATARFPSESGGILIGFRVGHDVYVADVLEIADDHSTGSRFVLRESPREKALASYRHDAPESPFGYVGSWHSHPAQAGASRRDMRTLRQEARAAQDLVAMLILIRDPGGWAVEAAVGYSRHAGARRGRWRRSPQPTIAGADVIRRSADQPTPPGYGRPAGAGSDGST
jgi:proteasome lid subunit RPN8/RPN11